MKKFIIEQLTEREKKILSLMAEGLSNTKVSKELNIAITTLKSHINNIYAKIGLFRKDFHNEHSVMRVKAILYYLKEFSNGNK